MNKKVWAFIFVMMCILINLITPVMAEEIIDMSTITAGAGSVLSDGIVSTDRFGAGEDKAETVAAVQSLTMDDSNLHSPVYSVEDIMNGKGPATLDESDPLYSLYGNDILMSNVTDSVNVRSLPSEDSEIVGKLYHNCAGKLLAQKDGWSNIQSGKVSGWVKNDYILYGQAAVDLAHQAGGLVATVTTDTLKIREAADENSKVYGLLARGEKIEVMEQTEGWIKVSYSDDTEGYISGDYVDLDYEIDEGETIEEIRAREEREKERIAKEKAEKEKQKRAEINSKRTASTGKKNTGAVAAGADDVTLLAALIQAECGREPYEGKLAVGAVVVNRAKGRYGSIYNAIYAPGQFGPAASGKVDQIVAAGPSAQCRQAAQEAISGVSNVGSATHFRNIRSNYVGIVIGNHVFW